MDDKEERRILAKPIESQIWTNKVDEEVDLVHRC
jgi:hypothetical protein